MNVRITKYFLVATFCIILATASDGSTFSNMQAESSIMPNSVANIIDDMILAHEGRPHGIPASWDWAVYPRVGKKDSLSKFRALTAWGQVYQDDSGSHAKNARVQIRNIKLYLLSKHDMKWHLFQTSQPVTGQYYLENFSANKHLPAEIRNEPSGGISVMMNKGFNFHFWPTTKKVSVNYNDVAGIYTTVQARLIMNDPSRLDDRSHARYLLSMGGDYWINTMTNLATSKTNRDIGIGRFKYITNKWQSFNMITLSKKETLAHPPPT